MNILEMKNVCKKYGLNKKVNTMVLRNINMTLENNEFLGIMGTSGSGKTTLLNIASGIVPCDEGEINICDNNICKMKQNELSLFIRSNIGIVCQDSNLLSSFTVKQNIMIPLILEKKHEIIGWDTFYKLANMLDIDKILERYPYEISGGQQQRTAICRAIIYNPKIILADEPTGNLDTQSSEKVLSYFELLQKECGASILMVTHDPFSASYCDRVVFLQDGEIIKEIRKTGDKVNFFDSIMKELQDLNTSKIKNAIR